MPLTALALVIVAALTHASWNLLAKQAADCRHFIWFYSAGAVGLFLPAVAWVLWTERPHFGLAELGCLASTCVLHLMYSESLQRGYRAADLAVVYPLARGTGPLLSFFGAMIVLGERPSLLAAAGAFAVVAGVFLIAGGTRILARGADRSGLFWGGLTGVFIAGYTLTDGYAVKVLLLSPLLVDYVGNLFRTLMLLPKVWRDRSNARLEYRRYWREALGVSVLAPLGYILILFAMRIAPVGHIAPAREMSMMVGAYFGTRLLGERNAVQRIVASGLIVAGVLGLALG